MRSGEGGERAGKKGRGKKGGGIISFWLPKLLKMAKPMYICLCLSVYLPVCLGLCMCLYVGFIFFKNYYYFMLFYIIQDL